MRYAYTMFQDGCAVGVEPEMGRIRVVSGDHANEVIIDDKTQLDSVIRLLDDAAEILGWHDDE